MKVMWLAHFSRSEVMCVEKRTLRVPSARDAPQQLRQLVAAHGVEPARRLVEDEQPRVVAQRQRQQVFHAHAARELVDALILVDGEQVEVVAVFLLLPVAVEPAGDVRDILTFFFG